MTEAPIAIHNEGHLFNFERTLFTLRNPRLSKATVFDVDLFPRIGVSEAESPSSSEWMMLSQLVFGTAKGLRIRFSRRGAMGITRFLELSNISVIVGVLQRSARAASATSKALS
mmetsp:Transcript_33509/g.88846  ORF Transcript_33509/g.88846 Transcript_33509/m.88846 type:complete len:114 (+) Transcript_33509:185-526(+)